MSILNITIQANYNCLIDFKLGIMIPDRGGQNQLVKFFQNKVNFPDIPYIKIINFEESRIILYYTFK